MVKALEKLAVWLTQCEPARLDISVKWIGFFGGGCGCINVFSGVSSTGFTKLVIQRAATDRIIESG